MAAVMEGLPRVGEVGFPPWTHQVLTNDNKETIPCASGSEKETKPELSP